MALGPGPMQWHTRGREGCTVDSLITDTPRFTLWGIGYEGVSGVRETRHRGSKVIISHDNYENKRAVRVCRVCWVVSENPDGGFLT